MKNLVKMSRNRLLVILVVVTLCGFTSCELSLENVYQEVLELRGAVRSLETKLRTQDHRITDLIKTVRSQRVLLRQVIPGKTDGNNSYNTEKGSLSSNRFTSKIQINRANSSFSNNGSKNVPGKTYIDHNRVESKKIFMNKRDEKYGRQERLLTGMSTTPPLDVTANVVACYAYLSTAHINIGPDHTIKFDVVKTNQRQGYHPGSGVFIAPESGFYVFTWTVRVGAYGSTPEYHSTEIVINNNVYGSAYAVAIPTSSRDDIGTGTAVAHVNQGDDVYIRTHSSYQGTGGILSDEFGRSSFAGWKIN
ncbi:uncharacterized protein LOC134246988 [Saccostrea cucullata]|uniref:uncharacterized protein LOC134246988 n=1 Tax=Saccostrea cuccullata TaxID=36930 RepID=UPI002ED1DB85